MKKIFFILTFLSFLFGAAIQHTDIQSFANPHLLQNTQMCGFSTNWFFQGGWRSNEWYPYNPNYSGYLNVFNYTLKCPSLTEAINYSSLPDSEKKNLTSLYMKNNHAVETVLSSIDFAQEKYLCTYIFNTGASFSIVKKINNCQNNSDFILKLLKDDTTDNLISKYNLDPLSIQNLGFVKINKNYDWQTSYQNSYINLKNYVNAYKQKIKETTNNILIDIKNSLNSHTNYQNTFPAFLTGLITLSPQYINRTGEVINAAGELNLKPVLPHLNVKNETDISKYANLYLNNFQNLFSTVNKKFWGFYFYLFANLNNAIANIIRIVFAFGTLLLFGYATLAKKSNLIGHEKEMSFKFDFSKKFVGLLLVFFAFTAPVVPSGNIKISDNYLYGSNPSEQTKEDYVTIVQGIMRYVWQTGNYFANYLNDYINYAFLRYMEKSVGIDLHPEEYLVSYNNNFKSALISSYNTINKIQFLNTYCKFSYPNIYTQYGYFPTSLNNTYSNIDNGYYQGQYVRKFLKDRFGIDRVSYKYCSNLSQNLISQSIFLAYKLNSFYNLSKAYQNSLVLSDTQDIKDIENLEKTFIDINNKAGWLSSVMLPIEEMIFKTRNIFHIATKLEKIQKAFSNQVIYTVNINQAQTLKNPIAVTQNGVLNKNTKAGSNINFLKDIGKKRIFDAVLNGLFDNSFSQTIFAAMSYGMFPGFNSLFKAVYSWCMGVAEVIIALIIGALMGGGFWGALLGGASAKAIMAVAILVKIIISYFALIISITLYQIFLTVVILILILLAVLARIILYYLEMAMTFILSYVIILWGLFIKPEKMTQGITQFFTQILKVGFMPIMITLSMVFIVIANNLIEYLYYLVLYIIDTTYTATTAGTSAIATGEGLGSKIIHFLMANPQQIGLGSSGSNIGFIGDITNALIHSGFHATSFIILLIIKVLVDLILIIKFSDWAFEIIGYRELISSTQSGMKDIIKQKAEQRFGGNII